jgi:DNA-directed RNA polymerase subunit beta
MKQFLGWAGKELGLSFASPIFDGAKIDEISEYTRKAGYPILAKPIFMTGVQESGLTSLLPLA